MAHQERSGGRETMLDPENTFFFSDPHFDHRNIIRYCNRPFRSVEEMNRSILSNYFAVVRPDSTVFFLGDMSFGRNSRSPRWWLDRLNMDGSFVGEIYYIKGSHDNGIWPTNTKNCYNRYDLHWNGSTLLLVHDPKDIPQDWEGWAIHGHTHSDRMFDPDRKRVCVCVEATGYRPVPLARIPPRLFAHSRREECQFVP